MRFMGWGYAELLACPMRLLPTIIEAMKEDRPQPWR